MRIVLAILALLAVTPAWGQTFPSSGTGTVTSVPNPTVFGVTCSVATATTTPTITCTAGSPSLGTATATSINGLTITSSTGTLTIGNGITLNAGAGGTLSGAAFVNTGTSGGVLGLLNANKTDSGNDIFSGTLLFSGLSAGTQTSCLGLDSGNHVVTAACGSGGASWNLTDGTTSLTGVTALTVPGGTLKVGGTAGAATLTPIVTDTLHAASATTANIGGLDDYNGSSITATLATLASGQFVGVTDQNASALTVALAGQTVVGLPLPTTLHTGGFYQFTFNSGSTLSGLGFPGFGTITSGALMKFTDGTGAATAGDLSGDCTTSGSLVVTCAKGSASVFGVVKVDGTTITASGGVITAVGAAASSITPGTTTIVGATAPCAIENSTSTTMACTAESGTGNFVKAASPALSGVPTAPTAAVSTNTTQVATTAFVQAQTTTDSITATWDSTTAVTAQTIDFPIAWTSYTITSVKSKVAGGGSFTVAVKIGGTNVTSCSAISVSGSTNTNTSCTAANTGSANDIISIVTSSPSGTVDQAYVSVVFTHSAN